MSYEFRKGMKKGVYVTISEKKETVAEVNKLPFADYPERGIRKEVYEKFGVRMALSTTDRSIEAIYFPYYNEDGKLTGYKKRNLTLDKYDSGHFSVVGKVGVTSKLFGQHVAEQIKRPKKKLFFAEGECLLPSTKVLTRSGWVALEDYKDGEVMQGNGKFAEPLAIVKKPFNGSLISIRSGSFKTTTTPEHNLVIQKGDSFEKVKAKTAAGKSYKIPRTVQMEGLEDESLLARIQVMISADFSVREKGDLYGAFKKERKVVRAKDLLSAAGVRFSSSEEKGGKQNIFIHRGHGLEVSKQFSYEKHLKHAKTILDEILYWDGNSVPNRNQIEYSTKDYHNAKFIQTCAHVCGYVSTIIPRSNAYGSWYKVSILFGKSSSTTANTKQIPYDGYVMCLTMPEGTLLVSEDDSISVTGNCDVLAVYQACIDSLAGTKYEGMEPFVVGLNCGCGNARAAASTNLEFIESFDRVVIGFDNDAATPEEAAKKIKKGKEALEDVGTLITKSEVYVADLGGFHDANDMLKAGKVKELSDAFSFATKKFSADKVVTADALPFESLVTPREPGVNIPQFPELMAMTGGPRTRELWVVTGPSGFGKSTVTSTMAGEIRLAGYKVGMIFLEEELRETILRMIAHKEKVNYNHLKFDPLKHLSAEKLKEAYDWVCKDEGFVFLDHFGSMLIDQLMSKIKYLMNVYDVQFVLLDHLSMLVSGLQTTDERKMLDIVMTELAAFCASHDVGIIAVSHLNRDVADEFKAPKGKENEPFFVNVKKESLRGSAALEQLSWVIIGVEPEIMPDKSRGRVRLTVLKNRPWGHLGWADVLKMNEQTGVLETANSSF